MSGGGTYPTVLAMWAGMSAVMMTPVVWPWLRALHRALPRGASRATIPAFSLGYGGAWLAFSGVMASAQVALATAGARTPLSVSAPALAGVALLTAGAFQFSPLKHACLDHCRSPMGYFVSAWRSGLRGALEMGLRHGLFCLGCCWAIMALALVVGAMDLRMMGVMIVVMFLETATPVGPALSRPLGGVLVLWGVGLLAFG